MWYPGKKNPGGTIPGANSKFKGSKEGNERNRSEMAIEITAGGPVGRGEEFMNLQA